MKQVKLSLLLAFLATALSILQGMQQTDKSLETLKEAYSTIHGNKSDLQTLKSLIATGLLNVNQIVKENMPLLHLACYLSTDSETVKTLLELEADPNLPHIVHNNTAVHLAACTIKPHLTETKKNFALLLENQGDINRTNDEGNTPFHLALGCNLVKHQLDIFLFFTLLYGADYKKKNNEGTTSLEIFKDKVPSTHIVEKITNNPTEIFTHLTVDDNPRTQEIVSLLKSENWSVYSLARRVATQQNDMGYLLTLDTFRLIKGITPYTINTFTTEYLLKYIWSDYAIPAEKRLSFISLDRLLKDIAQ